MTMTDNAPDIPPAIALATPFTIGLKPIDTAPWLVMDEDVDPFRAEKRALYAACFDEVNMAHTDTLDAQIEAFQLVREALKRTPASPWQFNGNFAVHRNTGERIEFDGQHPIATAALLIPDDVLLMRRLDDGWRLVAGSLAFPSSWTLREKFDKTMERIHRPVPIDDRMHQRITRIFDMLRAEAPLWRTNWSLDPHYNLREEKSESDDADKGLPPGGQAFLRTELQTLHKLPVSGDILFTVRTKLQQLELLSRTHKGRANLALLYEQFKAMDGDQRSYKGLTKDAQQLIVWLQKHVREAA
ncbi:MAG: DUF3445 domain-containing protein [Pseudomonadota bacterium]